MTVLPCDVGLVCPFVHFDEDGMALCTYPDIEPKRKTEYPLICNIRDALECELIPAPGSPLDQLLDGYDAVKGEPRAYQRTKVSVELRE